MDIKEEINELKQMIKLLIEKVDEINNTFTNTKIKEKISNINNIQTFKKTKEYEEKVMQEGIERGKEYIRKLEEKSEYIGDISKVANFDFDDKGQMIGFDKNKKPVYWEIFKNIEN